MKICVIGLGHVGLPLSIALVESGHYVIGVDVEPRVVEQINRGEPYFYEPGLRDSLGKSLQERRFRATINVDEAVSKSKAIFVTVGTPIGSNNQLDSDQLHSSIKSLGRNLKKGHIVILKSTVSPGATESIVKPLLERESSLKAGEDFFLAFSPERVVEGKALQEFRLLPKIVGGMNGESAKRAAKVLKTLGGDVIIVSSPKVAELVKLADNIYRDVNIALGNEIGMTCALLGVDAYEVIKAANKNYARNNIMFPGPGVGGACLTKDSYLLGSKVEPLGYKLRLIPLARRINEEMPLKVVQFVREMYRNMTKPIDGSKILVLGLAYKGRPDTDDIRNSPSKVVIEKLKTLGACLVGYDPVVTKNKAQELGVSGVSLKEGFKDASCVVVMTNHPSFFELDLERLTKLMSKPAGIVDCWHAFNPLKVKHLNLHYKALGMG